MFVAFTSAPSTVVFGRSLPSSSIDIPVPSTVYVFPLYPVFFLIQSMGSQVFTSRIPSLFMSLTSSGLSRLGSITTIASGFSIVA